ncbi:hypothetical protein [Pelagibius sp. Alg239-R121]|uniref:hypothetical protein n=1 Tax=Pelagibius sp. Alg239-R121 TaxID=2993448 RepID=UPI0024A79D8B|nr:hypothetical protein [Pelagibius sp. Alg239-R121]
MRKLGVIGSFASIFGLAIALVSFNQPSNSQTSSNKNTNSISGTTNAPVVQGSPGATININPQAPKPQKSFVLRNPMTGATLLVGVPGVFNAKPKDHICMVPPGTAIEKTGRIFREQTVETFNEVKILEGSCAGETGWVAIETISYE